MNELTLEIRKKFNLPDWQKWLFVICSNLTQFDSFRHRLMVPISLCCYVPQDSKHAEYQIRMQQKGLVIILLDGWDDCKGEFLNSLDDFEYEYDLSFRRIRDEEWLSNPEFLREL